MPKVAIHTLGCKVNQYDSDAMLEHLVEAGYEAVAWGEAADVYVINTCTVTAEADRKSRQLIRQAAGRNPDALIAVTGCYSQRDPEAVRALWGVDLVLGTQERGRIVELLEQARAGQVGDVKALTGAGFEPLRLTRPGSHTRANIKVQEGCDRFCTYCIIPQVRGPIRSRPIEACCAEVAALADAGVREFVLTGIHLASYGRDWGPDCRMADLLEALCALPGVGRIRLSSVEPPMLEGDFIPRLAALPQVCRHFHVALQSGCDRTLRRMGRRYDTAAYEEGLRRLRAALPGCAVTTDVIVGFPGETEEDFADSLAFVERMGFARLHVFPYSRREGTPAARMKEQLPRAVKRARAQAMGEAGRRLEAAYVASQVGRLSDVLLEEEVAPGRLEGYSGEYVRVQTPGDAEKLGTISRVRLHPLAQTLLRGEEV